ncbi:hypothetical protein IHV10_06435 [Fictibacillus sp. 5RED26]|uniref:hypothetical protein n=1 Tax=Fictibacillus sp. 5RED26 TaxID=2745876 RepID=UPI0018CD31DB|nr:hypothetical protein [Fictibacillus sp. 5RED26]MBH0156000.1 hypothetical protein [Fictibacillus sp. 5RED26]
MIIIEIKDLEKILLEQNFKLFYGFIKNLREEPTLEKKNEKLYLLRQLEEEVIMFTIAKAEAIESYYDHSKYFAAYVAIMVAFLLAFSKVVPSYVSFIVTAIILLGILYAAVIEKKRRVEAIYLKSLLNQINIDKKNKYNELEKKAAV